MKNLFPRYENWVKLCINPEDKWHGGLTLETQYNYYRDKCKICSAFSPTNVLEVGVCWGYSAFSYLLCGCTYTGLDIDDGDYNGMYRPTLDWARQMLCKSFPLDQFNLIKCDTRKEWPIAVDAMYDFVSVDGDHSYAGCMNDLQKVWPHTKRVLLADDYHASKEVQAAVNDFAKQVNAFVFSGKSTVGEGLLFR